MPNIGAPELLVILLVALVVFGPRKLPELGKSLGAGLREFRKSTQSLKDGLDGTLNDAAPSGAAPVQTIHAAAVTPTPVTPTPVAPASVRPAPAPATAEAQAPAQPAVTPAEPTQR